MLRDSISRLSKISFVMRAIVMALVGLLFVWIKSEESLSDSTRILSVSFQNKSFLCTLFAILSASLPMVYLWHNRASKKYA